MGRATPHSWHTPTKLHQYIAVRAVRGPCGCTHLTWLPPRGLPPATANRWDDPRTGSAQTAPIRASTSRAHSIWRPRTKTRTGTPPAAVPRPLARVDRPSTTSRAALQAEHREKQSAADRHSPPAGESGGCDPHRLWSPPPPCSRLEQSARLLSWEAPAHTLQSVARGSPLMAAHRATMSTWDSLDDAMVSGAEAYAATCPSLDWLCQGGSEEHARHTLMCATDGILSAHGHALVPEGTSTEELLGSVRSLRAKGASVVAVAPEALEVPRDSGAGDAAGLQLHICPEDVVIPVCETGLGISQILHVVLTDVAREVNWRAAAVCRQKAQRLFGGSLARVGLPHGALRGFDSPASLEIDFGAGRAAGGASAAAAPPATALDALTMHGLDFPPVDDDYAGTRVKAYVGAAATMDKESLHAEARLLDFAPETEFASLEVNFAYVFGRGTMPRAGQQLAERATVSRMLHAHVKRGEEAAAAGEAVPDKVLVQAVAARRALREIASATLYAAPFLRDGCHAEPGGTEHARTVFFVVGSACGPVANRLVEVATRLKAARRDWGRLGGVVVVCLPMQALETQLVDSCRAIDDAAAQLEALRTGGASASVVAEAEDALSVQDSSLQVLMAETYRALARVIRAFVPGAWTK